MRIYLISALSLFLLSGCATAEIVDGEEDTDGEEGTDSDEATGGDSGEGDPGATGGTDPGAGGGQAFPQTGGGPGTGGAPAANGSGGSPSTGGAPSQGTGGTSTSQPLGDPTCVPGVNTGDDCNPGVDTETCERSTRNCECGANSQWVCVQI